MFPECVSIIQNNILNIYDSKTDCLETVSIDIIISIHVRGWNPKIAIVSTELKADW